MFRRFVMFIKQPQERMRCQRLSVALSDYVGRIQRAPNGWNPNEKTLRLGTQNEALSGGLYTVVQEFTTQAKPASRQSLAGLNTVNFFLAEVAGVIVPFLSDFLRQHHWRYDEVGVVVAMGGFGTLLAQTPAGRMIDWVRSRRFLLGFMSLFLGACYGILPLIVHSAFLVSGTLFLAGAAGAFFAPLLGALALGLVGYGNLARTMAPRSERPNAFVFGRTLSSRECPDDATCGALPKTSRRR
jgi:hypothetical protein